MARCLVPDCARDASTYRGGARGWCATHYQRWRRHGDPLHGGDVLRQTVKGAPCSIDDCDQPTIARGWCENHYGRWKRHRDPNAGRSPNGLDPTERFWIYVDKTDECWLWEGAVNGAGYGTFTADDIRYMAHRFSWALAGRPFTPGLELDHLCHVRTCVRPDHLEEVTSEENKRRANEARASRGA